MRPKQGDTCLADIHTMINVCIKYDEPRLYGYKESDVITKIGHY